MTRKGTKGIVATALIVAVLMTGCTRSPESMLASAKEHLAQNDRSAAIIQLRNALQKNPNLAEARFLLGKSLWETGDLAAAEKELRMAAELLHPRDEVYPVLSQVILARGDYKRVLAEFGFIKLTTPQAKADLLTTLGTASLALGDTGGAKSRFESAMALVPDYPPALIGRARIQASSADLPGALALAETAIAKAPTSSEAWLLKGDIVRAQGDFDGALVAYRKAIEIDPRNLIAHYATVALLIEQGKSDEADKQLATLQKVAPQSPQTRYLQALIAYRKQDYAAARDAIMQYLRIVPDEPVALLLSARVNYALQSYQQVSADLRKVLQQVPNQPTARRLLVQTHLRMGQPDKALEAIAPLLAEQNLDADTLALIAEVYAQNGDIAKASLYFEMAAKADPKNTSRRTDLALAHLSGQGNTDRAFRELEEAAAADSGIRGDVALLVAKVQQGNFDAALTAVAALEKKQPDDPLPHTLRGSILLAKGDVSGARKSFEEALAKDPAYFPAAGNLARLDFADKKPDDAKKRFEAVLAKDPKNIEALLGIAVLGAATGASSDEVAKLIGKAIAADPTSETARLALIRHYINSKKPTLAVSAAQEALVIQPDSPAILDAAARAYLAAGNTQQTATTIAKLAKLQPTSPEVLVRTAELQVTTKDTAGALENLRKALAIKPDFVEAQRMMIALSLDASRPEDAIVVARQMQIQRPKDPEGFIIEGDIRAHQKAWNKAATAYRNGLTHRDSTDLAVRLHVALRFGARDADAEKFAASWLKSHPDDFVFRTYIADVVMVQKDYAAAAAQYRTILEQHPNDVHVLNNLAWILGEQKDPKAVEYAEQAVRLAPDNPAVLDTLGTLLADSGNPKRGIELLNKAVSL
ncbi:MAG TPA: XrtA/PEP-CTERM system TPR-repeat protein PrsT, partial [Dongiaceae bacterium]